MSLVDISKNFTARGFTVANGVRREEGSIAHAPSETEKCLFSNYFPKIILVPPRKKLRNVIVGCHDCNCSMHLFKLNAVDGRSPKKGHAVPAQF